MLHIIITIKMQININDIILENLTSELINNLKDNNEEDEIYINVNITEQNLKDFNERIINPSNINVIIKLCDFLMINYEQMKQLIINNITPTNEKYVLNDINKSNCLDLLFLENITIDDILEYDLIEWLKFKFNEYNKEKICKKSAKKGAVKCLKYAVINGCVWNENTCQIAAKAGQLECLKYLHENGCLWDKYTCLFAAANGHLECLKYAVINGCSCDKYACNSAAFYGHIECLKYLHENGCNWTQYICGNAVINGHLECLKYAHENGCPWDEDTCQYAAENGQLECLKYAVINGCPWNEDTCYYAAMNGQLECLKYAVTNGCPYDKNICYNVAKQKGQGKCVKYINDNM
jgi:hypothetical protein